jgi:hypothetical protein
MALRDRIRGLGRLAVDTMLDRVESALQPPEFVPTAASIDGRALSPEEEALRLINGAFEKSDGEALREALERGDPDVSLGSRAPHPTKKRSSGSLVSGGVPTEEPLVDPKALAADPFSIVEQLGFREKPSAITYGTLQAMVWKVPLINAVIQTRVNQVSSFATPQHHRFETGFRVRLRDHEAKPSPAARKYMNDLERFLLTTGATGDARTRDSFEAFLRKVTRDSLVYDQVNYEVIPGRDGRPSQFNAVDASTIRLADTHHLFPDNEVDAVRTVQIYDQVVIAEFTTGEMAFDIRNPRTDIRSQGYGTSELEMLISTITHILWGLNYNANFFAQGSVSKGLLNLKGAIPEKQLRAFRRQWYQMIAGVENAWRTPIVNAEDIQWINMHTSNRDMEFSAWIDFLIKVATAVYQIDPIEVNFKYGSSGQKSMFDAANKAKLVESRERGLKPLLRFLARSLNKHIIWPIDTDFEIDFVGLESQTPKELADLNTQRVRTMYTIDEVRAENDLPPLPDGEGEVILDANWLAARRAKEDREMQQQQMQMQQQQAANGMQGEGETGAAPGAGPPATGATPQQKKELEALLAPSKGGQDVSKSQVSGDSDSVAMEITI